MELEKILSLIKNEDISHAITLLKYKAMDLIEDESLSIKERYLLLADIGDIASYGLDLPIMKDYLNCYENRYETITYDDIRFNEYYCIDEDNEDSKDAPYTEEEIMEEALESGYFGCIFDW